MNAQVGDLDARMAAFKAAVDAQHEGRVSEAEAVYNGFLAQDPNDPDALHFLGLIRFQQARPDEAEALIRRSLELAPGNIHAWNNLGNVAHAEGRLDVAVEAYLQALSIDFEFGPPWVNLNGCIEHARSPERAIPLFQRIIESIPGFIPAYDALGRLLRLSGRTEQSAEVYARWLELEPDRPTPRHMLAALSQERIPDRADDAYVRELFDSFAEQFDSKLATLEYRAPQLVGERVARDVPVGAGLAVLDAGCGTGLVGPLLRDRAQHLAGVDLSENMVARARERGVYDELVVAELTAHLAAHPNRFDLVTCVDTLCYFGALQGFATAVHQALRPGGRCVFTVERWDDAPPDAEYRLQGHGRYAHAADYVKRTFGSWGPGTGVDLEPVVLRQEVFKPVAGLLVTVTRAD